MKELKRAGVTKFGKTSGRQRMTMSNIAEDSKQRRKMVV